MGKAKPISPDEINIELPDFVIEAVNSLIKKKYRGGEFSFTAKEVIAEGRKSVYPEAKKDWYGEKWMDFEKVFEEYGWDVTYEAPSYGDSDFESYYKFRKK